MLKDLVSKNRSYRRFYEGFEISIESLSELIDLARLSPSGRNAHPLKYIISNTKEKNAFIFSTLGWAGYLTDWDGPEEGERPSAYIIMLGDKSISSNYFCDHGIAAQSILLGTTEKGLGGCIIMTIKKEILIKNLNIPENYEILQVIALGKPKEKIVIVPLEKDGNYKYYRDEQQVHYVPKRSLDEMILKI